MTIYEIKRRTKETSPYYFDKKTMRFFGQRLKDFKVRQCKNNKNIYLLTAPSYDFNGEYMGHTQSYFDKTTNLIRSTVVSQARAIETSP